VKLELVDALAVAYVVLDAVHRGRAEDPNDATKSGRGQERFPGLRIVRPVKKRYKVLKFRLFKKWMNFPLNLLVTLMADEKHEEYY
jgi:hypothetical protein